MAKNTSNKASRAPGKTQISISLSQELVDKIDVLAAAENRNRSNFIATHIERLAEGECFNIQSTPREGNNPLLHKQPTSPRRR